MRGQSPFPLVWHDLLARMGEVLARWLPDKVSLGEHNKASVTAVHKVFWDPSGKGGWQDIICNWLQVLNQMEPFSSV